MEKYYTPDIEEFHVGFEYECKITFLDGTVKTQAQYEDSEWVKQACDSGIMYIERALHGKNNKNGLCGIRVKYLDHDDIVSLGFKCEYVPKTKLDTPIDVNFGTSIYKARGKFGATEYTIYFFKERPTEIEISLNRKGHWVQDQNTLPFTVKNKFELQKLLKQLDYE